jgi:hypothetical protein
VTQEVYGNIEAEPRRTVMTMLANITHRNPDILSVHSRA